MTDDLRDEAEKQLAALERWMAPLFAKTPHLPHSVREMLAKFAPWVALIVGVLGLFGILSTGMIWSVFSFASFGYGITPILISLSLLADLVVNVLQLLAYQPLSQRKKKGWKLLFYAAVISAIIAILGVILGYNGDALGQLIGSLISFWLLFEIRSLYHG